MSAPTACGGQIVQFKRLARAVLGKMLQNDKVGSSDELVPYLKAGHVQWQGLELPEELPRMWANANDRIALQVQNGDLLICEGGEVGRAAVVNKLLPQGTIIQNSLHLVRAEGSAETRYLKYALEHMAASGWIDIVCNKATIAHLTVDKLRAIPMPYWEKSKQIKIANFLDEQAARIDKLIAAKERLVEAVHELFKARLGTGVIEGLVESAVFRRTPEAGYERVREDWKLIPLKYLANAVGGMTPSKDRDDFWEGTIPWVSPKDMKRFILHDSQDHISGSAVEETSLKYQPVDSVLIVVRGMILAHTFPVAMNAVPVTINQDMKALRPKRYVSAAYLAWMLRGLQPLLLSLTEESAHGTKTLRTDQLFNQAVPVPSAGEQAELVIAFAKWEKESSSLSKHLVDHIERLREYRSSLISAAVTGQLDIDSYKSRLPEAA